MNCLNECEFFSSFTLGEYDYFFNLSCFEFIKIKKNNSYVVWLDQDLGLIGEDEFTIIELDIA